MSVYVCICLYMSVFVCICLCVSVYVYVCLFMSVYVCISLCMSVYLLTYLLRCHIQPDVGNHGTPEASIPHHSSQFDHRMISSRDLN